MMACLDEEAVLGLVEGRLDGVALDVAEAHLDGCTSCRDVVSQLARVNAPTSRELIRGTQLGRYVVGDLLGAGAMGQVYSAWQPELDRRVAIKVLHDASGMAGLLQEAQAMARLDHPNVVGVHEVSTLDDGVYVVMDLVEGDTLGAWVETPRDWREIVRVLIEIARGLAAVHAAGVIHRDIKPDNIIVGSDGRARLGDFGLARGAGTKTKNRASKLADSASFEDTVVATPNDHTVGMVRSPVLARRESRVTGSGTAVAGTPVYMALELLQGKPATAASDQFAFGVTAYEIIAGKRPFTGKTWADLATATEHKTPAPLRDVPGWLDAAIRRCLTVDPQQRFPSLAAVADHLADRAQRKKPIWIAGAAAAAVVASGVTWAAVRGGAPATGPSCTIGTTEIALVWNPGARAEVSELGAPTLAAIDGWSSTWATEHDATCEAARTAMIGRAAIAKTAARERCLTRHRDELAALLVRSRQLIIAGQRGDPGDDNRIPERMLDALAAMSPADCRLAEVGTADPLPANPDRASEARTVERELPKVRAAIALGDARPVIALAATMVERARQSTHAPSLAEALLAHGDALRATDQFDRAATDARDAVAAAERGHDDQTAARAWLLRVGIAVDRRDLVAADDLGAIASGAVDRAGSPPRLVAQLLRQRGLMAYYRNRFDESRQLLEKARDSYVSLSGERSTDVAGIETLLGATARASGDLDAAERHHRMALAIDRELRGPDHFDISRDLHNLAGVLRLRKDLDAAATTYEQALAIEIAKRGERSVQAGLTHNSLGLVKLERNDHPGARAEFTLALDILSAANHGDRAFAEHNLGLVAAAVGDHVAAIASYDRAAAIYTATIGDTALSPIRLHLDRARSFATLGRRDRARASATTALDAAILADIPWIITDAKALLAKLGPVAASHPPVERPRLPSPEIPPLPPGPPQPKVPVPIKDVGTYGSSPGRQ